MSDKDAPRCLILLAEASDSTFLAKSGCIPECPLFSLIALGGHMDIGFFPNRYLVQQLFAASVCRDGDKNVCPLPALEFGEGAIDGSPFSCCEMLY